MADDLGFQPAAQPSDNLGFQPAPQAPDMSGVQKTAQQNLTPEPPKEGEEPKEQKQQTSAQKLDAAMGFSVSTGAALSPDMRGHLIDAYKKGSASTVSDFIQSAIHSVTPIIAHMAYSAIHPLDVAEDVAKTGASEAAKGAAYLATSSPFSIASDVVQNTLNLPVQGATRLAGAAYEGMGGELSPEAAKVLTQGIPEFGQNQGALAVRGALDKATEYQPKTPAGEVTKSALDIAPYLAGGEASLPSKVIGAITSGAGTVAGKDIAASMGFGERGQQVGGVIGGAPGLIAGAAGIWDNHPGADIPKDIVAEKTNKEPASVTSQDIDNHFHDLYKDLGPWDKDFHNVAAIMDVKADSLYNIFKQTDIKPDQVYEDAQRSPETMKAVQEGRIPPIYDHLVDKRPPIPDDVQAALDRAKDWDRSQEVAPAQLSSEGASPTGLLSAVAKIFNPTGMSPAAGEMATAIRQGRGPVAQYVAQIQDGLSQFAKTISNMSDEARLNFIHYIETRSGGGVLDDPKLQALADKIRDIYSTMADKIQEIFPDFKTRTDYFTHQYTDAKAAARFYSEWAAKQGSERSLQQRVFPTLKEAMEAGLKPKTTNPIDTVMSYVTNIGNLDAAHRSLNIAREGGIADYFEEGKQPEGWVPLGGKLSNQNGKLLYAPEDAARVYNNDISKGFTGPVGDIVDAVGRVNNFNNMLELSLSLYHATVTTLSSMSKDVGRALTQGTLAERGKSLLSAVTPLKNTLEGGKLIGSYLGREELTPEAQKTMDALVRNNAINIKQQEYWKSGPARNYIDVFQHGSVAEELGHAKEAIAEKPITGTVKVIANEVGRVMNTISAPLFDHYIPRIKLAASFNEMHSWMRDHPDATPEEVDKAAQDIGNNSDNAFGEMQRDNLFWHNITRQSLQLAFLSYSWIAGAARMLQGIPDIGKAIIGKQELTSNARYLMGMAATYATINGARTYFGTGHAPNQILDFVMPRTGGLTPQGEEEREIIPSHIGQFSQYLLHGIEELGNEASPTLKLIYHLGNNSDFRGFPITNRNNSWFSEQRWDDYAHYVLGEETPIGLKTFITGKKIDSNITPVERGIGVRQAPREVTDPEGYKEMMENVNDSAWKKKERSDERMKEQYEENETP